MNLTKKHIVSLLLIGMLTLGLSVPVIPADAATKKNKTLEIPVNYTNSKWEDNWDTSSLTDFTLWNLGKPSSKSDKYKVSYKLYVPISFMKNNGADLHVDSSINIHDADNDGKWCGYVPLPKYELHPDGTCTVWNEAAKKDDPVTYAQAKKSGDFYVISYTNYANLSDIVKDDAEGDISTAKNYDISLYTGLKGIYINAKNSAIYFDDLKISKADGTVIVNKNFNTFNKNDGDYGIAPSMDKRKKLKTATIINNKVLTVKSTKATVKVGKTTKISAVATPATKITYVSSNKKKATVNSKGVVTGKKAGKVVISVKANGKTIKVTVTVKKK